MFKYDKLNFFKMLISYKLCSFSKKNSVKYLTSHYLGDY